MEFSGFVCRDLTRQALPCSDGEVLSQVETRKPKLPFDKANEFEPNGRHIPQILFSLPSSAGIY